MFGYSVMNLLLFNILDYSSDYFMYFNLYTLQLFSNENKVFVTDRSSSKCFNKTYVRRRVYPKLTNMLSIMLIIMIEAQILATLFSPNILFSKL